MLKTNTSIPSKMRAAVLTTKQNIRLEDRPVPQPEADQVLIQVKAVSVCGSDVHYYLEGRIGDFVVERPLVLGHEVSGVIVGVGDNVPEQRIGQRVAIEPQRPCGTCLQCRTGHYNLCPHMEFYATPPIDGAFQEYVTIQASFAHPISDNVSYEEGALLEPLSVGLWACHKAHISPGARVLIAGAGPIGILTAQAARAFGAAEIIVSDIQHERRQQAMKYGATSTLDPSKESVEQLEVDAFIDCSGAAKAVQSGIRAVRGAGYAVLVGMGGDEMMLPVSVIQAREINVTGTFRYTNTWPMAAHLVASKQVDLSSMITARYDLEHAEDALKASLDPQSIKIIVTP
ncbi:NAD(P)-dependent alcohol dehydrogenase [Aristophania vespae]|uniref:NAD(P)-dependent alcohol dehydrogenase n=1 Tax=Aristophania vespae TaxID=2697033 RepID=UPI002351A843|nr:NAD(P)-dependent alcohol dehydrogenase [Aristophania vespae]UMM63890.1 Sorbitol dehydrogenase [Aristophania vespae]